MKLPAGAKIIALHLAIQLSTVVVVLGFVTKEAERWLEADAQTSNRIIIDGLRRLSTTHDQQTVRYVVDSLSVAGMASGKSFHLQTGPPPPHAAPDNATAVEETREPSWQAVTVTGLMSDGTRLIAIDDVRNAARLKQTILWAFLGTTLLGLEAGGLLAFLLLRSSNRRVSRIVDIAEAVGGGDLTQRVAVTGDQGPFDRLGRVLNAMIAKLDRLLGELRAVTDAVAHDVRSPVMRMRVHAERALEATSIEAARCSIERVLSEADAILRITSKALDISRAEAGLDHETFAAIDLSQLVQDVSECYAAIVDAGMILEANATPELFVRGDRQMLAQIVSNLIDNVLRHAAEGGVCRIEVNSIGGQVRLIVTDRGPGIPLEHREEALRRFSKLSRSRSTGGAGLGLPLVAALTRLHQGDVLLEDVNPGLRVVICLPGFRSPGLPHAGGSGMKRVDEREPVI